MPELPEVETLRRSLEPHLLGRRVRSATLFRRDVLVVSGDPPGGFARARGGSPPRPRRVRPSDLLARGTVSALLRHGKQLAIVASDGRCLVVQLGMTGQLLIDAGARAHARDGHIHARWRLENDAASLRLSFRDPRRFGGLRAFSSRAALEAHWAVLGPDALTITPAALASRLAGRESPIKAALLDQGVLAGVGNIYADEALFEAGIHPLARAGRLSDSRVDALAAAIVAVLSRAIDARGSTLRDYRDADGSPGEAQRSFRVYARGGHPCPRCGCALVSIRAAQRTTTFCPACQPRRSSPTSRKQNPPVSPQVVHSTICV